MFSKKNVTPEKHQYDRFCKKINLDDCSIAIFQYELTLVEIKENFEKLSMNINGFLIVKESILLRIMI